MTSTDASRGLGSVRLLRQIGGLGIPTEQDGLGIPRHESWGILPIQKKNASHPTHQRRPRACRYNGITRGMAARRLAMRVDDDGWVLMNSGGAPALA